METVGLEQLESRCEQCSYEVSRYEIFRQLMLESHDWNLARDWKSQGGECIVDILGFKPLRLIRITYLIVAKSQINRAPWLAKITDLN